MKILFLDIDGVVNNSDTSFKHNLWPLDRYCAFLVGKIQLDTDCKVVLSSSWRHHPDGVKEVSDRIVPVLDITPNNTEPGGGIDFSRRGKEIKEWLDAHPEVTRYAIVDDENDMLPEQQKNFFKTDFNNGGLTDEIAARVIEHLNRD